MRDDPLPLDAPTIDEVIADARQLLLRKSALADPVPLDDDVSPRTGYFAKRARSRFSVGQSVVEKSSGRAARVLAITQAGAVQVEFAPGLTGTRLADHLEPA
jgi:hypothetical protein